MDNELLLCGVLLVSIALHGQALTLQDAQPTPGYIELQMRTLHMPQALEYKIEDKRDGPDPAQVRADAVDELLDSMEDATARWRDLEATYAEFLSGANTVFDDFTKFLDAETGEGISASDILPEEVKTMGEIYQSNIRAIGVLRDREEFFDNEISLLEHWRRLTQIKEFQIPECTDLTNAALLNAYNMEMVFSNLKIIAEGYRLRLESFLNNVYQEWQICILEEIAKLMQDPNFSYALDCEAGIVTEVGHIAFQVSLLLDKLREVGAKFDDTLATFKKTIETTGDDCYNTGRMLEAVDALIGVGVSRRENEVAVVEMNQSFIGGFQQWLDFFTVTAKWCPQCKGRVVSRGADDQSKGVSNSKTELVGLLEQLLDKKM